jgi:hypothetical protein
MYNFNVCQINEVKKLVAVNQRNGHLPAVKSSIRSSAKLTQAAGTSLTVRKVTRRAGLREEHHITLSWDSVKLHHRTSERLEGARMRKILDAIIQGHSAIGSRRDEATLKRTVDRMTLPPEVLIELERRCGGQYGD